MPTVFVIPTTDAVEAGLVTLNKANVEGWREIAATPEAVVVVDVVGRVLDAGFAQRKVERRSVWTRFPVFRLHDVDLLDERQVLEELMRRAPLGKRRDFCSRAGVHQSMITRIAVGDRRPSSRIVRALGLLRVPGTRHYIRMLDWQTGWLSDARGGHGGTRPRGHELPVGFRVGVIDHLERIKAREAT